MVKEIIELDNQKIEVLLDTTFPRILGKFNKITKKVIPNQPNIYRAFDLHLDDNDTEYKNHLKVIAYGYPKTKFAENGYAYSSINTKIGKLSNLPNLLNKRFTEII